MSEHSDLSEDNFEDSEPEQPLNSNIEKNNFGAAIKTEQEQTMTGDAESSQPRATK